MSVDNLKYHNNYATIKSRGVENKVYFLTIHKTPVRISGLEDERTDSIEKTPSECPKSDELESRFESSICRSRSNIMQLASNNLWDYFVTFTFSPSLVDGKMDLKSLNEVKKVVLRFFRNYAYRSGSDTSFKYLLIPEFHKSGNIHFHGLIKGINPKDLKRNEHGYLDFVPYCERFGFCNMSPIKDQAKISSYITKYICKGMFMGQEFEPGTHLYYASRGLAKDKLISKGEFVNNVESYGHLSCFDYQYCYKIVTDNLEDIADAVVPFINIILKRFKNNFNGYIVTAKDYIKHILKHKYEYDNPIEYNKFVLSYLDNGKVDYNDILPLLNIKYLEASLCDGSYENELNPFIENEAVKKNMFTTPAPHEQLTLI